MFFSSWETIFKTVLAGVLSYTVLLLFLRISGKRTLSKMNAFDLVVTVALGSTLSTTLVSGDVSVADGIAAMFTLIAIQYVVAFLSSRSGPFLRMIKSTPAALFSDGNFNEEVMLRERVAKEEVLAAIRNAGNADLSDVALVILETDGTFSVLPRRDSPPEKPVTDPVTSAENAYGGGSGLRGS